MYSIMIKDGFYNSSVVQGLRMLYSKNYQFIRSEKILPDLVFPFCSNLSFTIFYPDHLNKDGTTKIRNILQKYSNFIIIICISPNQSQLYENFLYDIPQDVKSVVCFPHDNFQKSSSSFIFETVKSFKKSTRIIGNLFDRKRKNDLNPDIQAKNIFSKLIKPVEVKDKILLMMKEETGTIRETMIKGLPELFRCDFYMESDSE